MLNKTIALKDFGTTLFARSSAKNILVAREEFDTLTLDFEGVNEIGQGFADQIFRVFKNKNPSTKIIVKNAILDVQKMITWVSQPSP